VRDCLLVFNRFSGAAEPNPLFESTSTFETKIESTFKEPFSGILTRQLLGRVK
jgi:hypothetical protein